MQGIFELSMPWWEFSLRGIAVYVSVLVMMRLAGKRSFGDMSVFDIVVLMVVGSLLRTAVIGKDTSVPGPLIAVASILLLDKGIGWLSARVRWFDRLVEGVPSILARDGKRDPKALLRHDIPPTEFERALRSAGLEDESGVAIARLEPNGKITLIRRGPAQGGG